jgi:hypothetical protein
MSNSMEDAKFRVVDGENVVAEGATKRAAIAKAVKAYNEAGTRMPKLCLHKWNEKLRAYENVEIVK